MVLEVRPLTPETWDDLVELFSRPGTSIPRACWCMFYRQSGAGADGAKSLYDHAGFDEVARRKPARPVVRKELRPQ